MIITYSGWDAASRTVQVGAYGQAVDVSPGQCTLVLTRGNARQVVSRAAVPDATTMQCGTLTIAGTALSSGSWTASVAYASSDRAGTSDPVVVEVPS